MCVCSKCGVFTLVELIRSEEVRLISETGGLERPQHNVVAKETLIRRETRNSNKEDKKLVMQTRH